MQMFIKIPVQQFYMKPALVHNRGVKKFRRTTATVQFGWLIKSGLVLIVLLATIVAVSGVIS
jgi:hypothetical protein